MEEMKSFEMFQAFEEVTDEKCVLRTRRKPISCRWRDINRGDSERVEVRDQTERDRQLLRKSTTIGTCALLDKQSCNTVKSG